MKKKKKNILDCFWWHSPNRRRAVLWGPLAHSVSFQAFCYLHPVQRHVRNSSHRTLETPTHLFPAPFCPPRTILPTTYTYSHRDPVFARPGFAFRRRARPTNSTCTRLLVEALLYLYILLSQFQQTLSRYPFIPSELRLSTGDKSMLEITHVCFQPL